MPIGVPVIGFWGRRPDAGRLGQLAPELSDLTWLRGRAGGIFGRVGSGARRRAHGHAPLVLRHARYGEESARVSEVRSSQADSIGEMIVGLVGGCEQACAASISTTGMAGAAAPTAVPKTPVNENSEPISRKNEVWRAGKTFGLPSPANDLVCPEGGLKCPLGRLAAGRADSRHDSRSSLLCDTVGHFR